MFSNKGGAAFSIRRKGLFLSVQAWFLNLGLDKCVLKNLRNTLWTKTIPGASPKRFCIYSFCPGTPLIFHPCFHSKRNMSVTHRLVVHRLCFKNFFGVIEQHQIKTSKLKIGGDDEFERLIIFGAEGNGVVQNIVFYISIIIYLLVLLEMVKCKLIGAFIYFNIS